MKNWMKKTIYILAAVAATYLVWENSSDAEATVFAILTMGIFILARPSGWN